MCVEAMPARCRWPGVRATKSVVQSSMWVYTQERLQVTSALLPGGAMAKSGSNTTGELRRIPGSALPGGGGLQLLHMGSDTSQRREVAESPRAQSADAPRGSRLSALPGG